MAFLSNISVQKIKMQLMKDHTFSRQKSVPISWYKKKSTDCWFSQRVSQKSWAWLLLLAQCYTCRTILGNSWKSSSSNGSLSTWLLVSFRVKYFLWRPQQPHRCTFKQTNNRQKSSNRASSSMNETINSVHERWFNSSHVVCEMTQFLYSYKQNKLMKCNTVCLYSGMKLTDKNRSVHNKEAE